MQLSQTRTRSILQIGFMLMMISGLSACGGGSSAGANFSIGGTISGLGAGKSVVLQNNGGDDLTVSANGGFTFATGLGGGNVYDVTVLTQPADQTCTVSNGNGTLFGLNVTDVAVTCVAIPHTIGGSISGLASGNSVVLQNNGGDDITVSADGVFSFATTLESGGMYNVTVLTPPTEQGCTVSNGSGTVSGADVNDVAVVCRAWGAAALIENDNAGNAVDPQLATDANGNAVAVWAQSDGSLTHIRANRYVAGSGWLTPIRIDSDNTNATAPQVTVDGSGNAVVVWAQAGSIWAARYTAGVGWSTATIISIGGTGADTPQIAMDANGDAVAVWTYLNGAVHEIWANHYTAGWGWGTVTIIGDNAGDAGMPDVAMDGNGNAVAVWQQSDATRTNIWANRYTLGSGWGTAALIESDNSGDALNPRIAVADRGDAVAVWQQSDATRTNIWTNRYTAGSGWDNATLIETDNSGDATNPVVAVANDGSAVAVWQQSDTTRTNIWTNRYTAGGNWDSAILIENDNSGAALNPQVSVGTNADVVAVWQQSDGSRSNIWANVYR
jgi:hypothetical protein